mmetsp:Transcript_172990/g.554671  ORF Transcript_172990/g.554671 Transcript_172990/m.554671 type:complete len:310 (+) Transcript_172990:276-1205(+)
MPIEESPRRGSLGRTGRGAHRGAHIPAGRLGLLGTVPAAPAAEDGAHGGAGHGAEDGASDADSTLKTPGRSRPKVRKVRDTTCACGLWSPRECSSSLRRCGRVARRATHLPEQGFLLPQLFCDSRNLLRDGCKPILGLNPIMDRFAAAVDIFVLELPVRDVGQQVRNHTFGTFAGQQSTAEPAREALRISEELPRGVQEALGPRALDAEDRKKTLELLDDGLLHGRLACVCKVPLEVDVQTDHGVRGQGVQPLFGDVKLLSHLVVRALLRAQPEQLARNLLLRQVPLISVWQLQQQLSPRRVLQHHGAR